MSGIYAAPSGSSWISECTQHKSCIKVYGGGKQRKQDSFDNGGCLFRVCYNAVIH